MHNKNTKTKKKPKNHIANMNTLNYFRGGVSL